MTLYEDHPEENEVLLVYQLSILPCPIYLQKGKFGDTPMIGHKLIGKARDLH